MGQRQVDAEILSDEDGGDGRIDGAAPVHLHIGPQGHGEGGVGLGHAQALDRLAQGDGQGAQRRGGGEGRLHGRARAAEEAAGLQSVQLQQPGIDHHDMEQAGGVDGEDELAQRQQRLPAIAADDRADQAEHPERRQLDHPAGDAKHQGRAFVHQPPRILRPVAQRHQGGAHQG
ncbi:hypothetical protein D3C80_1242930 [compost metagenome]